jgi:hypothetical protein
MILVCTAHPTSAREIIRMRIIDSDLYVLMPFLLKKYNFFVYCHSGLDPESRSKNLDFRWSLPLRGGNDKILQYLFGNGTKFSIMLLQSAFRTNFDKAGRSASAHRAGPAR